MWLLLSDDPEQFFNIEAIDQAFVVFTLGVKMRFSFCGSKTGILVSLFVCNTATQRAVLSCSGTQVSHLGWTPAPP